MEYNTDPPAQPGRWLGWVYGLVAVMVIAFVVILLDLASGCGETRSTSQSGQTQEHDRVAIPAGSCW